MARLIFSLLFASNVWAHSQAMLADAKIPRVLVPGHNKAYFTRIPKEDQLFKINYLDIYPNPLKLWKHALIYLDGNVAPSLQGLSNATLMISSECPDKREDDSPRLLTELKGLLIRNYYDWNDKVLHGGPNQILWERVIPYFGMKSRIASLAADENGVKRWNCSIETTVRLPDERILWSIQQDFELRWPPCEEDCCV